MIWNLIRTLTYGTLFVSLVLLFVPGRLLALTATAAPAMTGLPLIIGRMLAVIGALLALWSALTFALVGRGTPAPFDPPRRLVVRGPYRLVRNPMYLGAGLALAGAALARGSWALFAYLAVLWIAVQLFITRYEEPTLRRIFGADYVAYCRGVRRWLPRL